MKKTIFIAGGGTGGHIWPLIPIANRLKGKHRIFFVGQKNGEEREIAKKNGIKFIGVSSAKLQGISKINPLTYIYQLAGIIQSIGYVNKYQPSLILAKGGFAAFPIALAGYLKGVRVIVHESDSLVGKTNRLLALFAFRFLTGFPVEYYQPYYQGKMIEVGIPVRPSFVRTDLPSKKQILYIGGSQGSRFINRLAVDTAKTISKESKIVHICGKDNYYQVKQSLQKLPKKVRDRYKLIDFSLEIDKYIKESSLVISRCGATSIAELSKVGRPTIFIPFPYSAGNHQLKNGQIIQSKGAGVLLQEDKIINKEFPKLVAKLINNYQKRKELANNLSRLMVGNSVERVTAIIESIL